MTRLQIVLTTAVTTLCVLGATACGVHFEHLPAGSIAGRAGIYDYSPSAIRSGNMLQLWWCGADYNPSDVTQFSDSIQYESINLLTNSREGPMAVLAETQYAWDSDYTCNPKVIRGRFANPLGNGETYTYAMYYVALGATGNNHIGVAFSNNGKDWKKYPKPIISSISQDGYGAAQPAPYNSDHNSAVRMFYEDSNPVSRHIETDSSDGVHFTQVGVLTTKGLDPIQANPSWGDMAYDPETNYWYAVFNLPVRDPSTTGGQLERGQYGVELYRIPDASLFSGNTPWESLEQVDTNLTGYEANFIPSLARDPYGNLNVGAYPSIQLYTSISNPPPAWNASSALAGAYGSISYWDIGLATWVPNQPLRTLNQYFNQTVHEVTTGWIDPMGGFTLQVMLGHLYESPQQGATVPFYGCKSGSTDYFLSVEVSCGGARILGVNGYGYAKPVAGLNLVALYRCSTDVDHFVSKDPLCEGHAAGLLLGYALP